MKPNNLCLLALVTAITLGHAQENAEDADPAPAPPKAIVVDDENAEPLENEDVDPSTEEQAEKDTIIIPLPADAGKELPKLKELPSDLAERLIDEGEIEKPVEPSEVVERSEEAVEAPENFIKSDSKLHFPFQAKPVYPAPVGWTFRRMPVASKSWKTRVSLADGSQVDLEVRPFHLAVPSLGGTHFSITEPGFDPTQGYRQENTIGGILTQYDLELEDSEKALDELIRELDEILASLPSENPNQ